MYCYRCGKELLGSEKVCRICGASFLVRIEKNDTEKLIKEPDRNPTEELKENHTARRPFNNKKFHIKVPRIAILSIPILLVLGIIGYFGINSLNKHMKKKQKDTDRFSMTENDVTAEKTDDNISETEHIQDSTKESVDAQEREKNIENCYLIDYAVFLKMMVDYDALDYENGIKCEILDSDKDGKEELYVDEFVDDWRRIEYILDAGNEKKMIINSNQSASGGSYFLYDSVTDKVYLNSEYSVAQVGYSGYSEYNNYEFEISFSYNYMYNMETDTIDTTYTWQNQNVDADTYDNNLNSLQFRDLYNDYLKLCTVNLDGNMDDSCAAIEKHFNDISVNYYSCFGDVDFDGVNEKIYVINDYFEAWFDKGVDSEESSDFGVFATGDKNLLGSVIIVVDALGDSSQVYVDTVERNKNVTGVTYEDNLIIHTSQGDILYECKGDAIDYAQRIDAEQGFEEISY